jgi:DNA modification methylase
MQLVQVSKIRGNKNNPRTIKDERFKKLVESIKYFPEMLQKRNLIVESAGSNFVVLGGNQRLRAINEIFKIPRQELLTDIAGLPNEKEILAFYDSKLVPITLCDDWTIEQKREFIVRDNIDFGQWDMDKLSTEYEMEELDDWGLEAEGLDKNDLPADLENDFIDDADKIKTNIKIGDLIEIGNHRLLCGDSTKKEDVEKLMNGSNAELLFTSPPYSDMREYESNKDLSIGNLINFISAFKDFANYQVINLGIQRKNHEINQYWDDYILRAKEIGYKFLSWNVWDRYHPYSLGQFTAMFPIENEFIFVFGRNAKKLNCTIENKNSGKISDHNTSRLSNGTTVKSRDFKIRTHRELGTVQRVYAELLRSGNERIHPARFPVELPTEYIKAMTDKNDNVIEPFTGSGTTMVACQQLDRICYGMELEPIYCQVIINRMKKNFPELDIKLNGKSYQ